jgi:hypothetical protein
LPGQRETRPPSEEDIEEYLNRDLWLRQIRGENATSALDANYELGVRLRGVLEAVYPPPSEPPARKNKWFRLALNILGVGIVAIIAIVVRPYLGGSALPYVAIAIALFVYAYHQVAIEDLKMELASAEDVLQQRIDELEAAVYAKQNETLLDDFERWRSERATLDEARSQSL